MVIVVKSNLFVGESKVMLFKISGDLEELKDISIEYYYIML